MKAIILSSLIFFSLRAMSAEVGESKKPADCAATASTEKRGPKEAVQPSPVTQKPEATKTLSK